MSSKDLRAYVNQPLSEDIIPNNSNNEQDLSLAVNYIKSQVPLKDRKQLDYNLKWRFLLGKHSLIKKNNRKPKKTFLTRKERIKFDLLKLPKTGWNYQSLEPMRKMWLDYMRQNLNLAKIAPKCSDPDWLPFSTIAAKSELVGSVLKVVRSKVPTQVDMVGTVVLETKMTFQIVTPNNELKTIVKDSSVFEFLVDKMKFTVFGKYIATRPSERSVKKIKGQMFPDL